MKDTLISYRFRSVTQFSPNSVVFFDAGFVQENPILLFAHKQSCHDGWYDRGLNVVAEPGQEESGFIQSMETHFDALYNNKGLQNSGSEMLKQDHSSCDVLFPYFLEQ